LEQKLMISTPDQSRGIGGLWDRFTAPTERYRRPFRAWRRGRPFTAGLCILLSGLEIGWAPHTGVGKLLSMGLPGISSIFIAVFLVIFGVTVWFFPAYRVFSGIAAIMLALLSLIATNLGGFFLGFLLGMLGGAFAVAWTPRADYTAQTRRQRRIARAEQTAAGENAAGLEFTAEGGETAQSVALPAQTGPDEAGDNAEPAGEYADNTRIIEQAVHPDQAAPATDPTPEQE
jgi:Family of unknown function (DUF6114)